MDTKVRTLLQVDDELLIAAEQSMILEQHGYRVFTASSGEEAVKTIEREPSIDLILMDIDLGAGMDGTEAAKIILASHDIPVLFISSHTEQEVVEKTERITSYGYVVKGTGETVLAASIRMAFRLHEAHRELKRSADESLRLLEELRIHQAELEMQNEELRRAQQELEASKSRYVALYDCAPVGYCTVDEKGFICDANLTAAAFLGVPRTRLKGKALRRFIAPEDQDTYYHFREQLIQTGMHQRCTVQVLRRGGLPCRIQMEGNAPDEPGGTLLTTIALCDLAGRGAGEEHRRTEGQRGENVQFPGPFQKEENDGKEETEDC